MVGHPEWMEDRTLFLDRTTLAPIIDAWVADHTVEEVLDLASAFRIPNAPIANGANVTTFEHFRERETFVGEPAGRGGQSAAALPARAGAPAAARAGPQPRESYRSTGSCRGATAPDRSPGGASSAPVRRAAGPRHDGLLGRPARRPPAGAARRRGDPPRVADPARRRPPGRRRAPDRGPVLGARADLRRAQHQQEERDARLPRAAGIDSGAPLRRPATSSSRTTRRGCSTSSGSTTSAPGRPARPRHGADARLRARRPVARPPGVRLRDRGRLRAHLADRTSRTSCRSSRTASATPTPGSMPCSG